LEFWTTSWSSGFLFPAKQISHIPSTLWSLGGLTPTLQVATFSSAFCFVPEQFCTFFCAHLCHVSVFHFALPLPWSCTFFPLLTLLSTTDTFVPLLLHGMNGPSLSFELIFLHLLTNPSSFGYIRFSSLWPQAQTRASSTPSFFVELLSTMKLTRSVLTGGLLLLLGCQCLTAAKPRALNDHDGEDSDSQGGHQQRNEYWEVSE